MSRHTRGPDPTWQPHGGSGTQWGHEPSAAFSQQQGGGTFYGFGSAPYEAGPSASARFAGDPLSAIFGSLTIQDQRTAGMAQQLNQVDERTQVGRPRGLAARPTDRVGRPLARSPNPPSGSLATSLIHIMKKHKGTEIQPQDQASNASKGQKCTVSQILNVINPREKQNGQCRPDTWSPDLLQGRPTYPRRHFTRATTVLTANRDMGKQDQAIGVQRRWIGWSPDLGVGRPTTDLGLPPT
ncbi:hypothetical protein U9M48_039826 [Paspalum notatum var. saurae]|uniref:Uncharacterized protein n=1 Tax=Paspalum notatum var. saurae TaxID=547442 RepID=A0AAQ3UJP8_PASNO